MSFEFSVLYLLDFSNGSPGRCLTKKVFAYYCIMNFDTLIMHPIFSSLEPNDHRWAYRIGRPPSSVVVVRRCPHSLNIFSSETAEPIKVNYMELLWDGGTKFCSNGPGHMTKIAAMPLPPWPYMIQTLKNLLLRNQDRSPWNLVCSIGYSGSGSGSG